MVVKSSSHYKAHFQIADKKIEKKSAAVEEKEGENENCEQWRSNSSDWDLLNRNTDTQSAHGRVCVRIIQLQKISAEKTEW